MLNPTPAASTGKPRGKGPRTKKQRRRKRERDALELARTRDLCPGTPPWRQFMRQRGLDEFTGCVPSQVRYAKMKAAG